MFLLICRYLQSSCQDLPSPELASEATPDTCLSRADISYLCRLLNQLQDLWDIHLDSDVCHPLVKFVHRHSCCCSYTQPGMDRIASLLHDPASQCFGLYHRKLTISDLFKNASSRVSHMQQVWHRQSHPALDTMISVIVTGIFGGGYYSLSSGWLMGA
jgi:hypothetical protein